MHEHKNYLGVSVRACYLGRFLEPILRKFSAGRSGRRPRNLHVSKVPLLPAFLMQTVFGSSFGKHWTLDQKCCQPPSISPREALNESLSPERSTLGPSRNKLSLRLKIPARTCPPPRKKGQAGRLSSEAGPLCPVLSFTEITAFSHRKREGKVDICCRCTKAFSHQPDTRSPRAGS